jgi:hypothetical protein
VDTYTVVAENGVARIVDGGTTRASIRLAAGTHRLRVFATDRAGNRGVATSVRVSVE